MHFAVIDWIVFGLVGVILLAFVLLAWKDIYLMFQGAKGARRTLLWTVLAAGVLTAALIFAIQFKSLNIALGGALVTLTLCSAALVILSPGFTRIWAVGRTTIAEAWSQRVWLLLPLWFILAVVLMGFVHAYDIMERVPLFIQRLIMSQEIMLLVMFWVMACVSFPRERERKIVVTNASKPLNRLELLLGKISGFAAAAAVLILFMTLISWLLLVNADRSIRKEAGETVNLEQKDFPNQFKLGEKPLSAEAKKRLAEEGTLFAYNYVTAAPEDFSIAGNFITSATGNTVRMLKGGSMENAFYRFKSAVMKTTPQSMTGTLYQRPCFVIYFPLIRYAVPITAPGEAPKYEDVKINVSATRVDQRLRQENKTLTLNIVSNTKPGEVEIGRVVWTPDNPEQLFSLEGEDLGDIELTVTCNTPGVWLEVLDGNPQDPQNDYRNVYACPNGNPERIDGLPSYPPELHPVIRGFERWDRQQISGPDTRETKRFVNAAPEIAIFRIKGENLRNIPLTDGNFNLTLLVDINKDLNQELRTQGEMRVFSEDNRDDIYSTDFDVVEKRPTSFSIPARYLGNPDEHNRRDLIVVIACKTSGHNLSLLEDAVRIERPPSPFLLNLFKSEGFLFMESFLFIVVCIVSSVRLGWPVAMLVSAVFFIFGWIHEFVASLPDTGGLASLGYSRTGNTNPWYDFWDKIFLHLFQGIDAILHAIPRFNFYDESSLNWLMSMRNMPAAVFGWGLLQTVLYCIPFLAIGYLLIRKQELG